MIRYGKGGGGELLRSNGEFMQEAKLSISNGLISSLIGA